MPHISGKNINVFFNGHMLFRQKRIVVVFISKEIAVYIHPEFLKPADYTKPCVRSKRTA